VVETASLREVARIDRKSIAPEKIETGSKYVGLENIESGGRLINVGTVTNGELASSKFVFTSEHVLYGKLRPYLAKIALPEFDGICSTDIVPVLPGTKLDRRFLVHFLRQPNKVRLANSLATGANLPRLSPTALGEMVVPLPPLDEQRRIAAILDKADELRTKRRQALAHLDVLTQSIFQTMFHPRSNPHVVLGDCLSFVTSGGRGWAKYYSNSGSRFIRSLDVQSNFIGRESEAFVVPPENAEARRTRLKQGDVLLTITGSLIGRAAAITPGHIGAYVSQHVAILRPDTDLLSPIFLSHFLNLPNGGQQLIRAAQYGQTKPGLNFEQIRRFAIPQANLADQRIFEDRVAAVERLKDRHRAQLAELEALFVSLQHRAFRGEL
jgi:type I restriction enzyme S subunit